MEELAQPTGGVPLPAPDRLSSDGPRLRPPTPRVALVLVAAGIVGILLYLGREALPPFIVGLLIVYLLDPPVERLSRLRAGRLRVPRWLAILIVYVITIVALVEVLNVTLQPLIRQLADFIRNVPELLRSLDRFLAQVADFYEGLQLPQEIRDLIAQAIADIGQGAGGFDPSILLPVFRGIAAFIGTVFAFFIIPFWAFYVLKDRPSLTKAFDASLPAEWRTGAWAVIDIVDNVFGRWVRAQLVLGLTVGIATFIGLMVLSVLVDPVFGRFAVFFAVLAGLLELLPIIGPIISAVPPLLVALTVSPQAVVAVFLLYLAIQQLENTILVPKIQGDAVQLHPSAVVFALIVGGAIAGLLGAILALPITAAGRDIYRYLFRRLSPPPRPDGATTSGTDPPSRTDPPSPTEGPPSGTEDPTTADARAADG
jgi:predicted PurR-regulated permease PerM